MTWPYTVHSLRPDMVIVRSLFACEFCGTVDQNHYYASNERFAQQGLSPPVSFACGACVGSHFPNHASLAYFKEVGEPTTTGVIIRDEDE